ncbi:hypothetical protein G3N57_01790 [Paraburkholderia sp. Se-20369]|nr:hypothetical protein [Paraburkholderia sp. Se-20369]
MPEIEPSVMANGVMAKLYDVLTNGDDTVPKSEDAFFSWMTPGVPMDPSEFAFLTQGFTGVVKRTAVDTMRAATDGTPPSSGGATPTPPPALTQPQIDALMAQDSAQLLQQAENLSRLLDFIPDVTSSTNKQFARMSVANNDGTLSDVYDFTLRMSQVMSAELPDDLKAKIEKMRGLLQVVTKKKDLITDEETEVSEASPLQKAYFEKMAAYDDAALEYNARRIDAMDATNQHAIHDWAVNSNIYRNKVRAAMADWVANGYKDDFEKISAFIEQVTRRDMSLIKQEYLEDLERARLTGIASGSDFFYTALVPGNFATSSGWTQFGFSAGDFSNHTESNSSSSRWAVSASAGFFGIGAHGGASHSESHAEYHGTFSSESTGMTFEIAQIPIVRPWFRTAFLNSKAWRFDQNNPTTKNDKLSDGGAPPHGLMVAYPMACIFVRNVTLTMSDSSGLSQWMRDQESAAQSGGGGFSFGPFSFGSSASHGSSSSSSSSDWGYRFENNSLHIPGMQLIGFKCHVMPKSPDPDPAITAWI